MTNINKIEKIYFSTTNPVLNSTREEFGQAIAEIAAGNDQIIGLSADLTYSTKMNIFAEKFKNRFFHLGVAEQNMIGVAAGLALGGKIPVCTSYAIFQPGRCWEQIRQSICYSNLNVKMVSTHAGLSVGPDGASHQALEDLALTRVLPNLTVISPCDGPQAKKATFAMINHPGPVYLRLTREPSIAVTTNETSFEIGRGQIFRSGNDVTIISTGTMIGVALQAAQILAEQMNVSAQVINLHTLKPMDEKLLIQAAQDTQAIVTIEEHQIIGGLGSGVAEILATNYPVPMEMLGMKDQFGQSGKAHQLLEHYGLTVEAVIKAVKKVNKRKLKSAS